MAKNTKKIMKETQIDYMGEVSVLLESAFGKSDRYAVGKDKAYETYEIPTGFMENQMEEIQKFGEMIPDVYAEEDDTLGEESLEYSPEDIDFLQGIKVYKMKTDGLSNEEIEEFKNNIDKKISELDFQINYKWLEFTQEEIESHDESEEGLPEDHIENVPVEESLDENGRVILSESEESLEQEEDVITEEDDEEVEENEDGKNIFLVVYDGDLMNDESEENESFLDLKKTIMDNFDSEISLMNNEYDFLRDEIIATKDVSEETPAEEPNMEEPAVEETPVEESKTENVEIVKEDKKDLESVLKDTLKKVKTVKKENEEPVKPVEEVKEDEKKEEEKEEKIEDVKEESLDVNAIKEELEKRKKIASIKEKLNAVKEEKAKKEDSIESKIESIKEKIEAKKADRIKALKDSKNKK